MFKVGDHVRFERAKNPSGKYVNYPDQPRFAFEDLGESGVYINGQIVEIHKDPEVYYVKYLKYTCYWPFFVELRDRFNRIGFIEPIIGICTCDIKNLWYGCKCGAFAGGDR